MRRTRVDGNRAHRPCVTPEGGRGQGVRRHGGKGFSGIESWVIQLSLTRLGLSVASMVPSESAMEGRTGSRLRK